MQKTQPNETLRTVRKWTTSPSGMSNSNSMLVLGTSVNMLQENADRLQEQVLSETEESGQHDIRQLTPLLQWLFFKNFFLSSRNISHTLWGDFCWLQKSLTSYSQDQFLNFQLILGDITLFKHIWLLFFFSNAHLADWSGLKSWMRRYTLDGTCFCTLFSVEVRPHCHPVFALVPQHLLVDPLLPTVQHRLYWRGDDRLKLLTLVQLILLICRTLRKEDKEQKRLLQATAHPDLKFIKHFSIILYLCIHWQPLKQPFNFVALLCSW